MFCLVGESLLPIKRLVFMLKGDGSWISSARWVDGIVPHLPVSGLVGLICLWPQNDTYMVGGAAEGRLWASWH